MITREELLAAIAMLILMPFAVGISGLIAAAILNILDKINKRNKKK